MHGTRAITIWENTRRIHALAHFSQLVRDYYSHLHSDGLGDIYEDDTAATVRTQMNLVLDRIHSIICLAGVDPCIMYTPPPVVGGYVKEIDPVLNIFRLHRYDMGASEVTDFVDRARGVYEQNSKAAFIRSMNPVFWLSCLFQWLIGLPLQLLEGAGVRTSRIESHPIVVFCRGFLFVLGWLITAASGLLVINEKTGLLDCLGASLRNSFR